MSKVRRNELQNLTLGEDNRESRERLRELILFISDRCQSDPTFGAVKLNKILFYADFISFAKYGKSITGTQYQKFQFGPVPTAAKAVKDELRANKEIVLTEEGFYPYVRHRIIPKREANLDNYFTLRDIALVDLVINWLSRYNAAQVSEMSHDCAWDIAEPYEIIPYEAALLSDAEPTEDDIARAQELSTKFGWDV